MGSSRAGFVALAGRPNVGKSTLVNAVVGQKVAIVSDKPQTTRRAIRGVATEGDSQLVLIDLPGVQRPLDALTGRMQRRVEQELADTDAALFIVNAVQGIGPGDRFIAGALQRAEVPVIVAVNKVDAVTATKTAEVLMAIAELGVGDEYFPISARTGDGVGELTEHLRGLMPEGPFLYDEGDASDLSSEVHFAELIREKVLRRTFNEVPHAVEIVIEGYERRDDLSVVEARVWVETESQKGILVGKGGRMIKAIGTAARKELEAELGHKVHLELTVRVRNDWREDDRALDRLGID
ncbi:MAG TPA: GTPase Era [Baekduia sp.]|nr:GTPase Era [Baekduia sp.]